MVKLNIIRGCTMVKLDIIRGYTMVKLSIIRGYTMVKLDIIRGYTMVKLDIIRGYTMVKLSIIRGYTMVKLDKIGGYTMATVSYDCNTKNDQTIKHMYLPECTPILFCLDMVASACSNGFTAYGNSCYFFSNDLQSWSDANVSQMFYTYAF